ncbi:hypothetical protein NCS56_01098300 [Fusarium sp. Ph1]|nr:hypothetical protein NCS56_01098300 [Fusarium sp. Ph1]
MSFRHPRAPSLPKHAHNNALGQAVQGVEARRQSGLYTDRFLRLGEPKGPSMILVHVFLLSSVFCSGARFCRG